MNEKYLLFSLEDKEAKKLGEVISSSTCKKIVNLLVEKESSETEIAQQLKIPMNTVEYNLKKLLEAKIIETDKHFWSVKGKKIPMYKIANKLIVISPKKSQSSNVSSKIKTILPVILIAVLLTSFISYYVGSQKSLYQQVSSFDKLASAHSSSSSQESLSFCSGANNIGMPAWVWFALGALIALIAFLIWNWEKI